MSITCDLVLMRGIYDLICLEIANCIDTAHFSPSCTHYSKGRNEGILCTSHVDSCVSNSRKRSDLGSMGCVMFSWWHSTAFPHFCCSHCFYKNSPKCSRIVWFMPALVMLCNSNATLDILRVLWLLNDRENIFAEKN